MRAKLVFLGRLEDVAGRAGEDIAASAPLDWYDVIGWLGGHFPPELADAVVSEKVRVAINGALVADKYELVLADGDELAFLPPVSGG
ncbi:molybdopterin synthase sulfur carrier subunit [Novosphingobium sp. PhB165]|uniref:MoaD/ThiS family protein n=1 Tax=Novosphingobium sp. PhB165 TaxID=2485105 RepID=UPI00104634C5|nr:MoaD/ThiS family protein [Novosphingobium sp. PhB165]TCM17295.1 molybdopterin synthase sulfur carrier subunit [Novosphingobium sp. PhB165]